MQSERISNLGHKAVKTCIGIHSSVWFYIKIYPNPLNKPIIYPRSSFNHKKELPRAQDFEK